MTLLYCFRNKNCQHIIFSFHEIKQGLPRKSRGRSSNIYSTKTNLNTMLEESPVTTYCYQTCQVEPSMFPARKFCSVCGFQSTYKCLRCGMKYCSTKCLSTHLETRCLKWTA
ncbi:hypothetical protein BDF20DRAFT_258970 [Mycotypha africana]|uniref:uncharacterized protein n=1 Tax=Mycotypha africana TaxID=64632 RepID=UPI0023019FC1|nr:uncharacterized protein BDF20DRAFT_258970 [Mycotypha africana]KAI8987348.1 hypothetical protein BDF20DRAFT_258970 [Mycotypha africana]